MLLCLDIGFTATGYAVIDPAGFVLLEVGSITTKKSGKKQAVRVSDDDVRRCSELTRGLLDLIRKRSITGVVAELPHGGSLNSRAARSMGMATAVLSSVVEFTQLPAEYYTPASLKAITGLRKPSKEDVKEAALKVVNVPDGIEIPEKDLDASDAIAVAVAAKEAGNLYRLLRMYRIKTKLLHGGSTDGEA